MDRSIFRMKYNIIVTVPFLGLPRAQKRKKEMTLRLVKPDTNFDWPRIAPPFAININITIHRNKKNKKDVFSGRVDGMFRKV